MGQISVILAQNMKRLRAARGWTQPELAERSGFSLENIKRLETKGVWISADGVAKIADAFGCDQAELFSDPAIFALASERMGLRLKLLNLIGGLNDTEVGVTLDFIADMRSESKHEESRHSGDDRKKDGV